MSSRIGVIGAGVVGQATGRGFLAKGFSVLFIDVDERRIRELREEGLEAYTPADLDRYHTSWDVSLLTVSTPTEKGRIRLHHLEAAARDLGRRLADFPAGHLVVVRSTVPPGTTEHLVIPAIEALSEKTAGQDFGVCMNPEYLREQNAEEDFQSPWLIVIGAYDERSGDMLSELYRDFPCSIHRVSLREAELQKYVHNIFNATKISFFNEMRHVCRELGVDAESIFPLVAKSAEGMWNPLYGTRDLGPFDGKCLPKDTQAFLTWAHEHNLPMPLLEAAIHVNEYGAAGRRLHEEQAVAGPQESAARLAVVPVSSHEHS